MIRIRVLLGSFLLVLASFTFAADKPKLTLDDYFNSVDYPALQISPDGNAVVFTTERADWDQQIFRDDLWLYRNDGQGGSSLLQLTQSGHDSKPRWSPDGRWIAFLSERKTTFGKAANRSRDDGEDKDDKTVAQIFLISPSGGEAFAITSGSEEVHAFDWAADSKSIYFATRTPWSKDQQDAYKKEWKDTLRYRDAERGDVIYRLDLAQAIERHASRASRVTPDAEKDAGTTPDAVTVTNTPWRVAELKVAPDGQNLAFLTSSISQRMERLEEFEAYVVNLGAAIPTSPRRLTHNQAFEQDLRWSRDSHWLFFSVVNGNAEGKYIDVQERVYSLDVDTGQLQRWASSFGGSVTHYALAADGPVYFEGREGTEVQVYEQANSSGKFVRQPGWAGTYAGFSAAQHSPRVAFLYSALDKPTEVYLADSIDKLEQARPITSLNQFFKERDLPQGKPYRWKSTDGTPVEGMLVYPPGKFEEKNLPMLVLIHGGPADADGNHFEADWYQWDKLAATNGWLVFEPNYRGSVGYGDKFTAAIVPQIVSAPGKDILSGVDALVKDGIADPNRLVIGGYSYGGYMTNWLITQTTRFKAAVTGAGAVEHAANWGNDDMTLDDAHFLGGRPWEAPQRYMDEAALFQIEKVRTPTHMVAGADDIRVAVAEDYLLDRALHSLGIPSTLLIFPGEGHSLDKNPWHGKIKVREELKWLQKYGGVPAAP
jgi:dipeptidyl aminopeptidase/acylaminoacyl peptidase